MGDWAGTPPNHNLTLRLLQKEVFMYANSTTIQTILSQIKFSAVLLLVVMLAFSQGCASKKKLNAALDERDTYAADNQRLMERIHRVEAVNELLATKLVIRTTGAVVMHALYEELVEDLEDEIAGNQVTIDEMQSGIVVNLSEKVLFSSGSAEVISSGRQLLMKVGEELKEIPYQVVIAGFTDNVPVGTKLADRYPSNWELAGARAAGVVRVLEEAGVSKVQLRALSMGENMPIASNDTTAGRAKNRRIEIRMRPVVLEDED